MAGTLLRNFKVKQIGYRLILLLSVAGLAIIWATDLEWEGFILGFSIFFSYLSVFSIYYSKCPICHQPLYAGGKVSKHQRILLPPAKCPHCGAAYSDSER